MIYNRVSAPASAYLLRSPNVVKLTAQSTRLKFCGWDSQLSSSALMRALEGTALISYAAGSF